MRMTQAEYLAYEARRRNELLGGTASSRDSDAACAPTKRIYEHQTRRAASGSKPEQAVRHESVAEEAREARHTDRVHVRVVSFRRRLIDPDNLCPKYFVDCARYAGFIKDDRAEDITLEVSQVKVKTKTEERTEIEIL